MRLLVVSQYFWPERFRINDLVRGLTGRGHEITVLTGIPNYPEGSFFEGYGLRGRRAEVVAGATVFRVPLVPRGAGGGFRLALNYASFALAASVYGPLLCRDRYDVIFVCQLSPVTVAIPALVMKSLLRVPMMVWVLDLWPESLSASGAVRSRAALQLVDRMVRGIYARSDLLAVASPGFRKSLAERGVAESRIVELPNWYEPEYAAPLSLDGERLAHELPDGFIVMFAGNVGEAQDFQTILDAAEALRSLDDLHWVVLGVGRALEQVRSEVARRALGERFHLLGQRPQGEMPAHFARADVMLVTLRRDPAFALTIPGKIQSYMACGRPIAAALDGEGRVLVNDSAAGLTCAAGDAAGLAEIVRELYLMPRERREAMGERGRRYCHENFDRESLLDRFETWMSRLAERGR